MQRTNIFIAPSSEMHHERLKTVDLLTDMCSDTTRYVPVKWEYMDSAVHQEHKQSEYMRRLQKCEIRIVMFLRSLGLLNKALEIWTDKLGENHPSTKMAKKNIGLVKSKRKGQ